MIHLESAAGIAEQMRRREIGAREVLAHYLDRIERLDPEIGAFLAVDRDRAMAAAEAAQSLIDRGEGGPLAGVPVAVKDNISTAGLRTTCASRILENYVPPFDATVVERLRAGGCVVLGKTNLDEFAMGTSTENSAFQKTRNPWDMACSPGGSSGGSAAAVAGGLAPLALGSDTGGSIRQPAALCGVVGFKPTYGRASRYGLVAFGSSLDQIGPFARSVRDAALLAEAITGHDPRDSTSLDAPPVRADALEGRSLRGARIALPRELFGEAIQPGVRRVVDDAIARLAQEGAVLEEVSTPAVAVGVTTYYIIAPAEASSNLARFDGVRYGPRREGGGHVDVVAKTRGELFGHEVKARIMIGTYALSAGYYDAYYVRAQQVRAEMAREFDAVFANFDAVMSPTSPTVAFGLGELSGDPLALKMLDLCTIPANMGGYPAISINGGFAEGLPVGIQLMGPAMGDEALLALALAVERALPEAQSASPLMAG